MSWRNFTTRSSKRRDKRLEADPSREPYLPLQYSEAATAPVYYTGLVNVFYHFYLNPRIGRFTISGEPV